MAGTKKLNQKHVRRKDQTTEQRYRQLGLGIQFRTNKDRLCERSEPQSYHIVILLDEPDIGMELAIKEISFLRAITVKST